MDDFTDTQQLQERLRQKAEQRLAIIPRLADSSAQRARALAAVEDADTEYRNVWDEAVKLGWTEAELKGAGLSDRPGTPRRARTSRRTSTASVPSHTGSTTTTATETDNA